MKPFRSLPLLARRAGQAAIVLPVLAAGMLLAGCTLDPPGPAPIYSRLPANQSGIPDGTRPLTPEEKQHYDHIDKQVLREQQRSLDEDAAARAWSSYYVPPPVTVYGGYGYGGYGYGPGWGW